MNLSIVTLIFFVLAVVVFIQLRNVLGQRTGNERQPFDPYAKPRPDAEAESGSEVVSLPQRKAKAGDFSDIDAVAPAGSVLNNGLRAIRKVDPAFAPASFTAGVCTAYEMIMGAFARGDKAVLKQLLASDVYEGFARAIEEREAEGQTVNFSFVGMNKAEITAAIMQKHEAQITLRLVSEVISATYDRDDQLVDGDPKAIVELRDLWTFARDTRSPDPNWKLVATDEA